MLVNSIYDEVTAPKMGSSQFDGFPLRDNQSYASYRRESMDEKPTKKTNKYVSKLFPISVITLIVIVIALSGGINLPSLNYQSLNHSLTFSCHHLKKKLRKLRKCLSEWSNYRMIQIF